MPRILYADDHLDIQEFVSLKLMFDGFDVVAVEDGEAAVKVAQEQGPFDLILMDVRMPYMTGYEACQRLKEIENTKDIPVVFLTALAGPEAQQRGLQAGASVYITKPFSLNILIQTIKKELLITRGIQAAREEQMSHDLGSLVEEIIILRKQKLELLDQLVKERKKTYSLLQENKMRESELLAIQKKEQVKEAGSNLEPSIDTALYGTKPGVSDSHFPLSELSRLTDGIIHDIRNGMGVIRNTLGFLDDELANSSHHSDLTKISYGLDFCELVLRNLSSLGGQDIFQPEQINLQQLVHEVYFLLERRLVDVDFVVNVDPDVPTIWADKGHIKQIFMNLIKNAGEAMPNGGKLTFVAKRDGLMAHLQISDTGVGISQENKDRLFKGELFTTKETGYGLGLHVVHTLVKRHGGTIDVESHLGKGTTFTIWLPIE